MVESQAKPEKKSSSQKAMKRNSLFLWDAIKKSNIEEIQRILTEFPIDHPITDCGLTALAFACSWSTEVVIYELIFKFKPNVNAPNRERKTPLHQAALAGNLIACQILLKQPNILKNAQSIGLETPLMAAVRGGSVEAVAILLNGGVNPFHTNGLG